MARAIPPEARRYITTVIPTSIPMVDRFNVPSCGMPAVERGCGQCFSFPNISPAHMTTMSPLTPQEGNKTLQTVHSDPRPHKQRQTSAAGYLMM